MSHYSLGDIQGCFDQLLTLLDKINFNPVHDKLWFTGDLVNRGKQSLQVLQFVRSLGNHAVTVLGNHDLHLLAVAYGQKKLKQSDTFTDVLNAPDCKKLCHWLRKQPLLHHDATLGYTMVHAGIPPQWNLSEARRHAHEVETVLQGRQYRDFLANMYGTHPNCWDKNLNSWERLRVITNYFTRMRFCSEQGELELKTKGQPVASSTHYMPWFHVPNRANKNLKIIFGHWAALEGKAHEPGVFALDTGCVWGNCLTAMRLEDGKRFSVHCKEVAKIR